MRAEIIRLCLAAAGIEFKEEFCTERADLEKLISDGALLYHQLPLLEIDGMRLVQTGAILRYISRKAGLYGETNKDSTMIDMYFEGTRDFQLGFLGFGFLTEAEVITSLKEQKLPRYLPVFEKVIKDNGSGYVYGSAMTLADLGLLETTLNTVECFGEQSLDEYPNLKNFHKLMTEKERISQFLKGPQRKRKNDEKYIKEVKTVLNRF